MLALRRPAKLAFSLLGAATLARAMASSSSCPPCAATSATLKRFLETPAPVDVNGKLPRGRDLLTDIAEFPGKEAFSPGCFARQDESDDSLFYASPRFVFHIDEGAIGALVKHYERTLTTNDSHLDICSSWVSFFPASYAPRRAVGLGMVDEELKANQQLTETVVHDLNQKPVLPFDSNSFDALTCVVSIDYLTRPFDVLDEGKRVLRPGGRALFSFSNRAFWTKATRIWIESTEWQRVLIVAAMFKCAGFERVQAFEVSDGSGSDPMFVVEGLAPADTVTSEL